MRLLPGTLNVMHFGGDVSLYVPLGAYAGPRLHCSAYAEVVWLDVHVDGDSSEDVADGTVHRGVRDPEQTHADAGLWAP
jgi:hypothetical protein